MYSKTCVKRPLSKRPKIGFQDQSLLNAGQKYCRMLQGEHTAILLTFIKLPFVIKIFVLSILEWPFYTGFTVGILVLPGLSLILIIIFVQNMLSYYICCIYSNVLKTNFLMEVNTMNTDQTAPKGAV